MYISYNLILHPINVVYTSDNMLPFLGDDTDICCLFIGERSHSLTSTVLLEYYQGSSKERRKKEIEKENKMRLRLSQNQYQK